MSISNKVIKKFERIINQKNDAINNQTLYGTIKKYENGDTFVVLDGSNIESPINSVVDANNGDRVTVNIDNHILTVTGNLSAPVAPNVRMAEWNDLNSGNRKWWTSKVEAVAEIKDENPGGYNDRAHIELSVNYQGQEWFSSGGHENLSRYTCIFIDDGEICIETSQNKIILKDGYGIDIQTATFNDNHVTINGNKIITNNSPLFKTGTVTYSDTVGSVANTHKTYSKTVSIPSGYTLVGITAVKNNNHIYAQQLTSFHHSGDTVYASYRFNNAVDDVSITWRWLAIRNI